MEDLQTHNPPQLWYEINRLSPGKSREIPTEVNAEHSSVVDVVLQKWGKDFCKFVFLGETVHSTMFCFGFFWGGITSLNVIGIVSVDHSATGE